MALEGNLQDMSLVDLIQVFQMGPKSGILLLIGGLERGVIYVSQGRMIDAVVVRGVERHVICAGEEAVLHLLQWEEATFTFRHDTALGQRPVRITHDGEWLVLEGLRRRENPVRLLPHQKLSEDTLLELAPLPTSAQSGVNLDLDQWRLLSQVSVCQNLREICQNTGMEMQKTMRTASELIAIGLIEIVTPPAAPPRPAPAKPCPAPALQPALAAAGSGMGEALPGMPAIAGRTLIGAIMRRIRGL